jgi:hypothetical protein
MSAISPAAARRRCRSRCAPPTSHWAIPPDGWDGWTFGGAAVKRGRGRSTRTARTAAGPLPDAATLPLTLGPEGALRTELDVPELQDSARLTVEMDYEDANGETLTASTNIPLYASAVRLGIKTDGWMQRRTIMRLKVAALDLDGQAAEGPEGQCRALHARDIFRRGGG